MLFLSFSKNLKTKSGTAKQHRRQFRTLYQGLHYRLFAFWDKADSGKTLVISTHGIVKKTSKTPDSEIQKAKQVRSRYFEDKKITKKTKR